MYAGAGRRAGAVRSSSSARSTPTPGGCSARCRGSTSTLERLRRSAASRRRSCGRPPAAASRRAAPSRSTAAARELPEATPPSFDPGHLDALPARRGAQARRVGRVAVELGLTPEARMTDALLEVDDLTKHFPITAGIVFQQEVATVKAVDGRLADRAAGRDARHRRRVGLRQVDARAA